MRTVLAICAVVLLIHGHGASAASPGGPGGQMANVSVTKLGEVKAGSFRSERAAVKVDPKPIVLWAGAQPSRVLFYHQQTILAESLVEQRFVRLDDGSRDVQVTVSSKLPEGAKNADTIDMVATQHLLTADVNGDGVDELVLVRDLGGAEVYKGKQKLFEYSGSSSRPLTASYRPLSSVEARLPGRKALFILFERIEHERFESEKEGEKKLAKLGLADRYALVRVDNRGIARVRLAGLPAGSKVLAVGAVNRPRSQEVDELAAVSEYERDYFLSRHKLDGAAIGAPRQIYVPFPLRVQAHFLPQSERVVLYEVDKTQSVYFVTPAKPSNWIRQVDLKPLTGELDGAQFLGVADGSTDNPKVIVQVKEGVYAVNEEGQYFTARGGGWTVPKKAEPFFRAVAPSSLGLVGLFPSPERGDEFLAVYTRKKALRELSREEILRAAERFLRPGEIERERKEIPPKLGGIDRQRDEAMAAERKKKHVTKPVTTVEEWKHFLPESYAARAAAHERIFYANLEGRLTEPSEITVEPGRYRNEQEYWTWFKGLEIASETSFALVRRGAVLGRFTIPGYYSFEFTEITLPGVNYRLQENDLTVVMWSVGFDAKGNEGPGFYLVRAGVRQ